jgi:hypothetical protein
VSYILDALKKAEEQRRKNTSEQRLLESSTITNLDWLIEKYEKRMTELETEIGLLRRNRNVLLEASRLLEEEGL